jgi:transposase InsO family protein
VINHKRLHRVYCALKLNLPRRTKRRLPTRLRQPLLAPLHLNEIWALDFMADTLYVFESIDQVRTITEGWLRDYNEERPHDSLGRVPPLTFMPRRAMAGKSTFELYP